MEYSIFSGPFPELFFIILQIRQGLRHHDVDFFMDGHLLILSF